MLGADDPRHGPPPTLPVVAAGIPEDLRALPQFVVWAWVYRDGRWCKPPLRADGLGPADSDDARTWASCAAALAAHQRRQLDGIGLAIGTTDPFFFVDLDDCRDPRTGTVAPWATRILDQFRHTYQELSPSATGYTILGRGIPPGDQHVYPIPGGKPRAKIELFAAIKYTTLTGHRLPSAPATVCDAQAALEALYSELFLPEDATS
jgi:primase-polymerase (primpol)-like protein